MTVPVLSNTAARRLFLHRHGLVDAPTGADVTGVISSLGFVQLDSVNTFSRAHDMILWSRGQRYRPAALQHALSRDRMVFEHWTHDAAAIDMALYPHWRLKFARDAVRLASYWRDNRRGDLMTKIDDVLRQVSDGGPCQSGDVGKNEVRGKGGWWDWHPSKTALEFLWRSGQLSVVHRDGFKKVYDLTERVIPPEQLNAFRSDADTVDWACGAALDKLGFATSGELAAFWGIVTPSEAKTWATLALADGRAVWLDIEGTDGRLRRSLARPDLMDSTQPVLQNRVRILSPFDPALRDRKRAERVFGFHYRIEIFVPAPKRQYGYYVFPVLEGDCLVGRIDMKADRPAGILNVTAFWPEAGIVMGAGRRKRLNAEITRAARFGGCADIVYAADWVRA